MLEQVCTEFVGLNSQGGHGHFATYEQWESWLTRQQKANNRFSDTDYVPKRAAQPSKPKKLSYKEQQEYDGMEVRILEAETARDRWQAKVEDPAVAVNHLQLQEAYEELKVAEREVEHLYARWAELEAKHQAYSNG